MTEVLVFFNGTVFYNGTFKGADFFNGDNGTVFFNGTVDNGTDVFEFIMEFETSFDFRRVQASGWWDLEFH